MENRKNNLWDVDKSLFTSMVGNYVSPEEANFFKTMQFKEEYEPALANDVIMSEHANKDNIYIVRVLYDEYLVGKGGDELAEIHTMNLCEALHLNLCNVGLLSKDITLLDWLRSINYRGVTFDNNYDLMQ
jgi:hypothetical protein